MEKELIHHISHCISEKIADRVVYITSRSLSGGCINNGFEFITNRGSYFVKTNSVSRYPGMFYTEAKGLEILRNSFPGTVPGVIYAGEFEQTAFLILQFIGSGSKTHGYWQDFAVKLASLHRHTAEKFGLDHDNYIGSLPQQNKQYDTWTEFFITQRLKPLLTKAVASGLFDSNTSKKFDVLFAKLDRLIPSEKPALIHGDLWSGNVMTDEKGEFCLIDPAVYYGHREVDLAFSTLFGAFPDAFYETYHDVFPLEEDWKQRIGLFNLYPLLVHLLLFGSSYYPDVKRNLEKYL